MRKNMTYLFLHKYSAFILLQTDFVKVSFAFLKDTFMRVVIGFFNCRFLNATCDIERVY